MTEFFEITSRKYREKNRDLTFLGKEQAEAVRRYHESFPMYSPTPLAHLPETAKLLGLGDVYVKDESKRFGLNAF